MNSQTPITWFQHYTQAFEKLAATLEQFSEGLQGMPSIDQKTLDKMNVSIASPGLIRAAEKWNKRVEQFDNSTTALRFPAIPPLKMPLLDADQVRATLEQFKEFCEERDVDRLMRNCRQSEAMPQDKTSKAWRALRSLSLKDAADIGHFLPSLVSDAGRPIGAGPLARKHAALMTEMERLVECGMNPTAAARKIAEPRGPTTGIKHRADYLVKKFRAY